MVSLKFFCRPDFLESTQFLKKHDYQEYFQAGKGERCVALTSPHSCADCP